jgi:hypothetical protein
MFRLYREIMPNEFFVVFGDTAQGGADNNLTVFLSKTRGDIPLVMQKKGMATEMTPFHRDALHYIHNMTKVKPVIALERQNGGASAMYDLHAANVEGKYTIYYMRDNDGQPTDKMGFDTNVQTRPKMLGEYLTAFNSKLIKIYDKEIIEQHQTFIVNKNGKPEAAPNTHDDAVMACAGAWQLHQTENPPAIRHKRSEVKRLKFAV